MKTRIDKKNLKRLQRELKKNLAVRVGVFGDKAGEVSTSGVTVGQVAAFAEFGTVRVDARSWLVATIQWNREEVDRGMARLALQVGKGGMTQTTALNRVGLFLTGKIRQRIAAKIRPLNAKSTIRRKKSSTPLIDKGQFRNAIAHEIIKL